MIAVIFEVWPARSSKDEYLAIAATLREDLRKSMDSYRSSDSRAFPIQTNCCRYHSGVTRKRSRIGAIM